MKKLNFIFTAGLLALSLVACSQNDNSQKAEQQKNTTKHSEQESKKANPIEEEIGNIGANEFYTPFNGKIEHIHGLGYVGNQDAVFFAAHDGLKVYENGKWFKTKKENNDYMGFNAVQDGFYSSGHPGADSILPNPIGIKKSQDNGKTLENLALEGKIDFHAMGVGYENNTIYVMNPEKNSLMEANKFYVSLDDAKSWQEVSANGLESEIMSIAVHPTNSDIVAVAAKEGIYLSKDQGENFDLLTKGLQGTAVFFTEEDLWYGGYNGNALLVKRTLADSAEKEYSLPEMKKDAVLYFAQNQKDKEEFTLATFNGNIYQTVDGTKTWNLLVKEGKVQ